MEHAVEAAEQPAEGTVHAARQRVLGLVVAAQQQRGKRGRQRERVDGRDHRRDRDGHRELAVELTREAADEGQRHEHGHQHQRDGDDGARHLAHRAVGRFTRREPRLDVALHVLHHHDGVVHHDADRQHQPEQAQRVDREAQHVQHGKGTDHRHRHGQQRNDRRAPGLQEQDHHQHHQHDGFEQRVDHRLDRRAHELRRVVGDAVFQAFGHVLVELFHRLANVGGDVERVGARGLEHAHADGRVVVQQRTQRVVGRAHFKAADVAQPGHGAVGAALDDDVAEFFFALQAPLRIDRELHVHARQARRCTHHAGRGLHVLAANGSHHVGGREAALRDLLRVEPDAHGVVAAAEDLHLAHAFDARERVLHVQHRVVAQVVDVVAVVRRDEVDHHRQVGRALDGRDAEPAHFLGQARLGLRDAVLHELLRLVGVGAQAERDGQREHAVGGCLAAHVEHAFDAVDLLLDGRGNGLGDHLGVGPGVRGAHHHRGRRDFRVLRDRQPAQRDQPGYQHQ
jgi:hypothetical protein